MQHKNTGIKRIVMATIYSIHGLKAAMKSEAAVRQEVVAIIILVPVALWVDVSLLEKLTLICSLLLVLITELLNTAIETVVDRVSFDQHELSGKAKDIGSAAVFISLLVASICWFSILITRYA
ncbi:diacylglycerol kinase [Alteromonas sediminis]|uniref:Diacylglycerol kinase n=1 Tax=Alteromonas sediminis TaxID=2259342 RepID=A0A3N5Y257_9ALTE|nr:diacylglycerol kinase [Alteromonas sediminis]RPJ67390.1 diacylglycerol kinase [Alteromonas sediminis]